MFDKQNFFVSTEKVYKPLSLNACTPPDEADAYILCVYKLLTCHPVAVCFLISFVQIVGE